MYIYVCMYLYNICWNPGMSKISGIFFCLESWFWHLDCWSGDRVVPQNLQTVAVPKCSLFHNHYCFRNIFPIALDARRLHFNRGPCGGSLVGELCFGRGSKGGSRTSNIQTDAYNNKSYVPARFWWFDLSCSLGTSLIISDGSDGFWSFTCVTCHWFLSSEQNSQFSEILSWRQTMFELLHGRYVYNPAAATGTDNLHCTQSATRSSWPATHCGTWDLDSLTIFNPKNQNIFQEFFKWFQLISISGRLISINAISN